MQVNLHTTGLAKTKSGRKELQKLFGDPTTEYSELISISPAYRASEITIPVLIVHGSEDRRVDVEHAYRLKAMLEANGKRYSWSLMEGVGHSPPIINGSKWQEHSPFTSMTF